VWLVGEAMDTPANRVSNQDSIKEHLIQAELSVWAGEGFFLLTPTAQPNFLLLYFWKAECAIGTNKKTPHHSSYNATSNYAS